MARRTSFTMVRMLQNRPRDFPPHIPPLSCNAVVPTVRLGPGEAVPVVRNLAPLERVVAGWKE